MKKKIDVEENVGFKLCYQKKKKKDSDELDM